jgi:hypothetical protein
MVIKEAIAIKEVWLESGLVKDSLIVKYSLITGAGPGCNARRGTA